MKRPETINGMTFEMAQTKVQGTKFKAIHKFKAYTTIEFDYDDLVSEVDMAILKAWRGWNPDESLFNTYATNMINWMLFRALENHNDVFKMNRRTKMNLNNRGESFKTLTVKKVTADKDFNAQYELDGKTEFTRELFNLYVYHTTSKVYGITVQNQTSFNNDEGDAIDVLSRQPDETSDRKVASVEFNMDLDKGDPTIKKVYDFLNDGYSIKEAIEMAGTTKARLKTLYIINEKKLRATI